MSELEHWLDFCQSLLLLTSLPPLLLLFDLPACLVSSPLGCFPHVLSLPHFRLISRSLVFSPHLSPHLIFPLSSSCRLYSPLASSPYLYLYSFHSCTVVYSLMLSFSFLSPCFLCCYCISSPPLSCFIFSFSFLSSYFLCPSPHLSSSFDLLSCFLLSSLLLNLEWGVKWASGTNVALRLFHRCRKVCMKVICEGVCVCVCVSHNSLSITLWKVTIYNFCKQKWGFH